jgi:hypothetical protein
VNWPRKGTLRARSERAHAERPAHEARCVPSQRSRTRNPPGWRGFGSRGAGEPKPLQRRPDPDAQARPHLNAQCSQRRPSEGHGNDSMRRAPRTCQRAVQPASPARSPRKVGQRVFYPDAPARTPSNAIRRSNAQSLDPASPPLAKTHIPLLGRRGLARPQCRFAAPTLRPATSLRGASASCASSPSQAASPQP